MNKQNLFLKSSLIVLLSCTTIPWDQGSISVSQLNSDLKGNKILEHLSQYDEINNSIKVYGNPKTIEFKSKDNSVTMYYPKNNLYLKFYSFNDDWVSLKNMNKNPFLETFKIKLNRNTNFTELAKFYTGDSENEARLKLVNPTLKCLSGELLILPAYLASNTTIEKLRN